MKMFTLERDIDHSGISSTGTVAEGVLWSDGTASIRWLGDRASVTHWSSLIDAMEIHGHDGATRFEFIENDDRTARG